MKCRVCLNYLLDVPDKELDASAYKKSPMMQIIGKSKRKDYS